MAHFSYALELKKLKFKRYAEGEVRTHEAYAVDCLKFSLKATPFDRSGTAANECSSRGAIKTNV